MRLRQFGDDDIRKDAETHLKRDSDKLVIDPESTVVGCFRSNVTKSGKQKAPLQNKLSGPSAGDATTSRIPIAFVDKAASRHIAAANTYQFSVYFHSSSSLLQPARMA